MFSILVVEDDENFRKLMEAILRDEGYLPILAQNAQQALDRFEHHHIDLMITDIMMPGMDGYSLTQELREAG
ncbi:MAG: response regulator [Eubacteriaceae bacterium]|nr:response regulator [Eubacteriaceae bacterium]